uniref:NADH-ubiquinone oxidoreductase chain 3 n=1 Tax=Nephaspis sp. DPP-2018 TaxID=2136114 RepID=A0A343YVM3_9CUCU|nr:NADH dehydrogenase subunit 3 [Nephaspis sp. DPP-2018]
MLFILTIISMLITFLMLVIVNLISKKSFKDREKNSPFECGFDPKNSARLPFSIQFFLITLIFLIFDVEITLIIPFIFMMKFTNILNITIIYLFFIMILIGGLFHEWNQGVLNWNK